jgi:hypothetical protein
VDANVLVVGRGDEGLTALSTELRPLKLPTAEAPRPDIETCVLRWAPLSREPPRGRLPVLRAWDALADSALDEDALYHALLVAIETMPLNETATALPPLPLDPEPPRATAAHPRAFRGTRAQPPKAARAARLSLRPYVCDRRGLRLLRERLSMHLPSVVVRLAAGGLDRERLDRLDATVDPYFAYHHGGAPPPRLPARLTTLLAAYRGKSWASLAPLLESYFGLGIDEDELLYRALMRLVHARPEPALAWLGVIAAQPAGERSAFATLLAESPASAREPIGEEFWRALSTLAPPERYRYWVHVALYQLAAGVPSSYLLAGFTLARDYQPSYQFGIELPRSEPHFDPHALDDLLHAIDSELDRNNAGHCWEPLRLWRTAGELPGLTHFISRTNWHDIEPDVAHRLVLAISSLAMGDQPLQRRQECWRHLVVQLDALVRAVRAAPASHRIKLVAFIEDILWFWDHPDELRTNFQNGFALATRLAAPPFAPDELEAAPLIWLLDDAALAPRVFEAPDAVFVGLERELRARDPAVLCSRGLGSVRHSPLWPRLIERWLAHPHPLARAMRTLAGLSRPQAIELLRRYAEDPLIDPRLLERSVADVCAVLADVDTSIVPRKLRAHVEGREPLKPAQLDRALRLVAANLPVAELKHLEQLTLATLAAPLAAAPLPPHALQLIHESDGNRRAYRRFLRAWAAGETNYRLAHPATREWVKRHPQLDLARWQAGIDVEADGGEHGKLRLAIEQDPIEALRLGSYVGSCLQPGGLCSYSAVAVVLDVNKQVVYARTPAGQVIARQIVAISDDHRLVCFHVYPQSSSALVKRLFRDYDNALAQALELPLLPSGAEEYAIANVLSQEWWDDSPWDFTIDDSAS